jgi:phosphohistidine phosphatase
VLLRHAKAERAGSTALADVQRPLALVGRRQSSQVGAALAAAGLVPDVVLCSSSVRTRQTWELSRAALGATGVEVRFDDTVYLGGVAELVDLLRELDDAFRTVLVVGHEPTMSRTAAALAGDGSDSSAVAHVHAGIKTGTFSVLEFDQPWRSLGDASGRLVEVVAPVR